jgi:hypothetical protein
MRAIGYARVSTEEQSQQGVSLSNQVQKIQAYCMAKDWEMIAVIRDEGYSGKDLNRPGVQEIIKGCRKRAFDVVVTMKLDRLTRSVKGSGLSCRGCLQQAWHCILQPPGQFRHLNGQRKNGHEHTGDLGPVGEGHNFRANAGRRCSS